MVSKFFKYFPYMFLIQKDARDPCINSLRRVIVKLSMQSNICAVPQQSGFKSSEHVGAHRRPFWGFLGSNNFVVGVRNFAYQHFSDHSGLANKNIGMVRLSPMLHRLRMFQLHVAKSLH
jgi:hypothetical protein